MSLYYQHNRQQITVQGQTYPFRLAIKALGGRFWGEKKIWIVPYSDAALEKVMSLCQNAGGGLLPEAAGVAGGEFTALAPLASSPASPSQEELIAELPSYPSHLAKPLELEDDKAVSALAEQEGFTVSQLMQRASLGIQQAFPEAVWVIGEIQNLQRRGQGFFFDLAEADEKLGGQGSITIKAILWTATFKTLKTRYSQEQIQEILQDGIKIRAFCQVQLYQGRGQLSLQLLNVDLRYTQGALALAREQLLKELRQKGLDKINKSRLLVAMPLKVGLLSAAGSRAESDFLHQLFSAGFPGKVLFVPCAMQGERVAQDVVAGLQRLLVDDCDVIVITRGGGSAADLRWFDSREIALAIAHCPVPVIAAIGHHDDFCVAEEVCYERQKTPTAAADFILGRFQKVKERLEVAAATLQSRLQRAVSWFQDQQSRLGEGLGRAIELRLNGQKERLHQTARQLERSSIQTLAGWEQKLFAQARTLPLEALKSLHLQEQAFDRNFATRIPHFAEKVINQQSLKLEMLQGQLLSRDPLPWLNAGWTRLEKHDLSGKVTSIDDCQLHDRVKARLFDGQLELEVVSKVRRESK